jgi:hypothetical protein
VRVVQAHEPLALFGGEVGDPAALEPFVPAFAALRGHALRNGNRNIRLVGGTLHEFHELRFGEACFAEQRGAQTRREMVIAEVAAAQRRTRFVDRARQEHEAREPRTRIARRSPAQTDRAHHADGSRHL